MKDLSLVIAQGGGPALLGRDWLAHIRLDWSSIANHSVDNLNQEEHTFICGCASGQVGAQQCHP